MPRPVRPRAGHRRGPGGRYSERAKGLRSLGMAIVARNPGRAAGA